MRGFVAADFPWHCVDKNSECVAVWRLPPRARQFTFLNQTAWGKDMFESDTSLRRALRLWPYVLIAVSAFGLLYRAMFWR
jgi:hypothetical protein